tara:strand:- start:248 stop:766 length:519 start_codon:yes stop_codon:yes gene_type:complete
MSLKKFSLLLVLIVFLTPAYSESLNPLKDEHVYNLYSGTFDTIDKEGDAKTSFFGIEHNNTNLFKETILGKFSPVTGGFLSGKNGVYLYTGVQAEYDFGPLSIVPSFTPGYYERGEGKELGSALEFKSEIKLDFEILKDSKIGFSYSHISNNDWGDINPGINNKQISFSKIF